MTRSPPPAVYARDTPLAELRTAELVLTSTLRLFASAWRAPGENLPDWRGGLLRSGAEPWAASAFDGLFAIVVVATRRPLDVGCPCCPVLSPDEGRLLQLVSLFQHGRPDAGEAVLGEWLPPAAQRLAAAPADGLGRALSQAGLVVPWRHAEAACLPTSARGYDRGLIQVH